MIKSKKEIMEVARMSNLSQIKRQRMIEFLERLKEEHKDDDVALIALGEIESELNAKKYGLVWEDHEEAVDVKMQTHIPVFTEETDKEISTDENDIYNFILEGDNLHSLRLLEKTHQGKIDVIYIDPPYNTGNKDFRYDDTYVGKEDGYFHSKWLSFLEKRLRIASALLSNKGIIFISINDIEQANLQLLCNEIFGSENYIGTFIWKNRKAIDSRNKTHFSNNHEYVLTFAKKIENAVLLGKEASKEKYSNPDNDPRGIWLSCSMLGLANAQQRPNLHYDLTNPETGITYSCNPNTGWRYSKETMEQKIREGRILWPDSKNGRPREKKFYSEIRSKYTGISSILPDEEVGYTEDSSKDINSIFNRRAFDFPKPVALIRFLISQVQNKNAIVLDFFAGSGTTAQAVMELNKADGGHRQFIICTNNENEICETITYPRIKTVITGKRVDGSNYSEGISANLKYYRTDFVSKDEEYLSEVLLDHIAEMIKLEHGVKLDGKKYILILEDDEADMLSSHWDDYPNVKALYVSKNVLFTTEQNSLFKSVDVYIIPDYYFNFELREVGETW